MKMADKFEQIAKAMKTMTPAEMSAAVEKYKGMCTCPTCPTYTGCAKKANETLFCATGRSFMCITFEKQCICPTCPVTPELGLKNTSYCTKGSEKAQRYEHALWGSKIL
jgi:hypothetical protein